MNKIAKIILIIVLTIVSTYGSIVIGKEFSSYTRITQVEEQIQDLGLKFYELEERVLELNQALVRREIIEK